MQMLTRTSFALNNKNSKQKNKPITNDDDDASVDLTAFSRFDLLMEATTPPPQPTKATKMLKTTTTTKTPATKTLTTPVLFTKNINSIPSIVTNPLTLTDNDNERSRRPLYQYQQKQQQYSLLSLLLISYILLVSSFNVINATDEHLQEQKQQTLSATLQPPAPPQVAALASPVAGSNIGGGGGNGGGISGSNSGSISGSSSLTASSSAASSSSSILEQFSPNCSAVSHIFLASGIKADEVPVKPSQDVSLRYCELPSVGTCCTYNMENKMAMQSRSQLEKHSKDQILKLTSALSTKAQKFNEVFRKLLLESKDEFHSMFMRTYGVIYQQNSYVFSDLFMELENYYARGRVDLMTVMDKFFNILYQKMFQVLNAQYTFDQKYLQCVSLHMKELKPFGDVPDKLSLQIKRSFVATRTYAQALGTAADVAKKLIYVRLNSDCTAALTKMQHCGACKGYAERPCTNYCVNVIKGCLHYLNEFDVEWENFVSSMDKVAERLLGSFNIVMVVEPINIKISEAIMNFQDAGQDITNRVFQGCGRPALGRAKRSINPKFTAPIVVVPPKQPQLIFSPATLPALTQADQMETDILDIDATLDESIVLREKRTAEPGRNSEENSSPRTNNNKGVSDGTNNGDNGMNNNNNRQQNRRKQQNNRKNDDNDLSRSDPILDRMVRDIRQKVKDSKKFWSNLPYQICSNDEISTSSDVDGMCWNGHTIDRYMHSVSTEHGRNPEFPGNPATTHQTAQVTMQLNNLKNAINQLRNAYNGQDVDWSEQEEPYYASGSGSGGGSDDEDDDEGSGLGIDEPYGKPNGGKGDHIDHPAVRINNEDDEDADGEDGDTTDTNGHTHHTSRPATIGGGIGIGGGGGGVGVGGSNKGHETNTLDDDDVDDADSDHDQSHKDGDDIDNGAHHKSSGSGGGSKVPPAREMSLRRALLLYLLPLYMAWFGGICADLL